jgi:hypothetical protein
VSAINTLFDELSALSAARKLPPVQQWHPERTGTIDIRIARDGTWYHEGDPILRQPLVDLFATILRKDPDGYCLVTPAEKLLIEVEDAPFQAIDVEVKGEGDAQQLLFTTNVGDYVLASTEHPVVIEGDSEHPRPYLAVRDGLRALIGRSVYYRLSDLAQEDIDGWWLTSAGTRFRLG